MTNPHLDSGERKLEWARAYMPIHAQLRARYRAEAPFAGLVVAVCSHVEAKTGVFIETLRAAGAEVVFTGSEPKSSQDDVVAALNTRDGITGYIHRGVDDRTLEDLHASTLEHRPNLILDDAAELTAHLVHRRAELRDGLRGVCEQTTTGVHRLHAMAAQGMLTFPAYAVNDTPLKHEFDNIHGTGESSLSAIMATTNVLLAGRCVVVAGYGDCGVGIAQRARAWGARVIVTEIEPRAALRAHMHGFEVAPMVEAARLGELFITTTGNRGVIDGRHFEHMRDGAILANAGHFNIEIDVPALAALASDRREVRPGVESFRLADGREIRVVAEGRLVNLAAPPAMGHPIEVMDQTFAMQFMAALDMVERGSTLGPGVHRVPDRVDRQVAEIKLDSLGVRIDDLTDNQRRYLDSWKIEDIKP